MLDSEGFSSFSLHAYEPLNEGPGKDCLSGPLSATDLLHCMIGDFETVRRSNVFKGEEGGGEMKQQRFGIAVFWLSSTHNPRVSRAAVQTGGRLESG